MPYYIFDGIQQDETGFVSVDGGIVLGVFFRKGAREKNEAMRSICSFIEIKLCPVVVYIVRKGGMVEGRGGCSWGCGGAGGDDNGDDDHNGSDDGDKDNSTPPKPKKGKENKRKDSAKKDDDASVPGKDQQDVPAVSGIILPFVDHTGITKRNP